MNNHPVFRSFMLSATTGLLIYYTHTEQWPVVALLGLAVILDVFLTTKVILGYEKKYRLLQTAACFNTAIVVSSSYGAWSNFDKGEFWTGWVYVSLALLNLGVVFMQQRSYKQAIAADAACEQLIKEINQEFDLMVKEMRDGKSDS